MRNVLLVLVVVFIVVGIFLVIDHKSEGSFEITGKSIDSAIENAGDKLEDATDRMAR